jgi:hypothetical protein
MKTQTQRMLRSLAGTLVIAFLALVVPAARASSFSADLSVAVVAILPAGVIAGQAAPANLVPGCVSFAVGNASAAATAAHFPQGLHVSRRVAPFESVTYPDHR